MLVIKHKQSKWKSQFYKDDWNRALKEGSHLQRLQLLEIIVKRRSLELIVHSFLFWDLKELEVLAWEIALWVLEIMVQEDQIQVLVTSAEWEANTLRLASNLLS